MVIWGWERGGGEKKQVFIRHLRPFKIEYCILCSFVITTGMPYFASPIYWK
jgi:hypothetical protein